MYSRAAIRWLQFRAERHCTKSSEVDQSSFNFPIFVKIRWKEFCLEIRSSLHVKDVIWCNFASCVFILCIYFVFGVFLKLLLYLYLFYSWRLRCSIYCYIYIDFLIINYFNNKYDFILIFLKFFYQFQINFHLSNYYHVI